MRAPMTSLVWSIEAASAFAIESPTTSIGTVSGTTGKGSAVAMTAPPTCLRKPLRFIPV